MHLLPGIPQVILFDVRLNTEGMIGRRRAQCPFQTLCTFPDLIRGLLAPPDCLDDNIGKHKLAETKAESTDRRDHVEIGKLYGVVRNPAWHAGQTDEVLRKEQHVDEDG